MIRINLFYLPPSRVWRQHALNKLSHREMPRVFLFVRNLLYLHVFAESALWPASGCAADFESEHDVLNTVEAVAKALADADCEVHRLSVGKNAQDLVEGLTRLNPDVVFNLFEGTADHGHTEATVAGLLEWWGVPFTGSPAEAL